MEMNRRSLEFKSPWINAAGTLGFTPPAKWPLLDPPAAFVTNPVSYHARVPADDRAIVHYSGGFLLHTGLPSPSFRQVLNRHSMRWARSPVPVWVHLIADTPIHIDRMIRQLEELDGVEAVELSFNPQAEPEEILDLIGSAVGEIPLVVSLPLTSAREPWLAQAVAAGIDAISLAAPRGCAYLDSGRAVYGRLYGPALLPLAAAALEQVLKYGLPVIAGGGVMKQAEIDGLLRAGAAAVQLDCVLWRGWQVVQAD